MGRHDFPNNAKVVRTLLTIRKAHMHKNPKSIYCTGNKCRTQHVVTVHES